MTDTNREERLDAALNKLAKWRAHFAGWMFGTRSSSDPQAQAIRNIVEGQLILRAEVTMLTGLLLEKGVFTREELQDGMIHEAGELERMLEERWPGCKAGPEGMHYSLPECSESMKGWLP